MNRIKQTLNSEQFQNRIRLFFFLDLPAIVIVFALMRWALWAVVRWLGL